MRLGLICICAINSSFFECGPGHHRGLGGFDGVTGAWRSHLQRAYSENEISFSTVPLEGTVRQLSRRKDCSKASNSRRLQDTKFFPNRSG